MTPEKPNLVCKEYLDSLLEMITNLEIPHIFVHADQMVYAKKPHHLEESHLVSQIKVLMGGFHQLRVRQRLLYKRHALKGYKQWWIDAETIASGSADQATEGGHYYRCMRTHEAAFEENRNNLANVDNSLLRISLRKQHSKSTLMIVMATQSLKDITVLLSEGSEKKFTIAYLEGSEK